MSSPPKFLGLCRVPTNENFSVNASGLLRTLRSGGDTETLLAVIKFILTFALRGSGNTKISYLCPHTCARSRTNEPPCESFTPLYLLFITVTSTKYFSIVYCSDAARMIMNGVHPVTPETVDGQHGDQLQNIRSKMLDTEGSRVSQIQLDASTPEQV